MGYYYKWKPSKAATREFAEKMDEIAVFCKENNISHSASMDSFYFTINGKSYRVSNHSVEASNARAYNWMGDKIRDEYHLNTRDEYDQYIHASKTRIMDVYNDLKAGYELDGRGYRKTK